MIFKGNQDEAYNKALFGAPNNSQYYWYRGVSFQAQDKIDEALDDYLKCYELDPNSYFGPMSICETYNRQKNWSEADKWANLLISKHPENQVGYREKALILLYGYGELDKAREILNEGCI